MFLTQLRMIFGLMRIEVEYFFYGVRDNVRQLVRTIQGRNRKIDMEALGFRQVGEGVDTKFPYRNFNYRDYEYTDGENVWKVRLKDHTANSCNIIADFGMFPDREYMMGDRQEDIVKMLEWLKFPPMYTDSRYNKIKNLIK